VERASSQEPAEKPVPLIRRLLSGMYSIDPDGQGVGDAPNYVHCDIQTGRIGKLNIKITSIISCFTHFYLPGTSERHQSLMTGIHSSAGRPTAQNRVVYNDCDFYRNLSIHSLSLFMLINQRNVN
jgi:hypothetical protein